MWIRTRLCAVYQLLRFYRMAPLYETFMAWVKAHPELCKEPEK